MKRREFISKSAVTGLSVGLLTACGGSSESTGGQVLGRSEQSTNTQTDPGYDGPNPFQHGVASGDPTAHQVILWTRLTAEGLDEVPVQVTVATNPDLRDPVYQGVGYARSASDFTIKLDPLLPEANQTYYYQFSALGHRSAVGRTRTTPEASAEVDHLRLAVTSCSAASITKCNTL
ncbi:MAG: PhoD-like phosphatase N-terminal domain-containing protein [Marinobacter sp.]|nr:PhoD-like phosphatase N-terminal domain-containing protein [Marinobacter sp.]